MGLTLFDVFIAGPLMVQNFWIILLSRYDESEHHVFRDLYYILVAHSPQYRDQERLL